MFQKSLLHIVLYLCVCCLIGQSYEFLTPEASAFPLSVKWQTTCGGVYLSAIMKTKKCSRCKKTLAFNMFGKDKSTKTGLNAYCKKCIKERHQDFLKDPERVARSQTTRKKYALNNPEKINASYLKNKEKYNEAKKIKYYKDLEYSRGKLRNWYKQNIAKRLYDSAKRRANYKNINFSIKQSDIIVPKYCPVLGIELSVGEGSAHDGSPSLDRVIPSLGYIKENIIVVSHKANTIKNNATIDELEKVYFFYKKLILCQ
jgi:hypothetical protein